MEETHLRQDIHLERPRDRRRGVPVVVALAAVSGVLLGSVLRDVVERVLEALR